MFNRVPNINEFNIRFVEQTEDPELFVAYCLSTNVEHKYNEVYDENGLVDYDKSLVTLGTSYDCYQTDRNSLLLNAINYTGDYEFVVDNRKIHNFSYEINNIVIYKDRTIKKVINSEGLCVWDDLTYYIKYNKYPNLNIKKKLNSDTLITGVIDDTKEFI